MAARMFWIDLLIQPPMKDERKSDPACAVFATATHEWGAWGLRLANAVSSLLSHCALRFLFVKFQKELICRCVMYIILSPGQFVYSMPDSSRVLRML